MLPLSVALIVLIWLAFAAVLIGVGLLLLRAFHCQPRLDDAFWMGLAAWVGYLLFWHLVLPISLISMIVPAVVGAIGLYVHCAYLKSVYRDAIQNRRMFLALYAIPVLVLAICCVDLSHYGDTGLYGMPAVRWAQAYRAVPGLANLHWRLAFDSAEMLCVAAFGSSRFPDLGFHVFETLLIVAAAGSVLAAWIKAWENRQLGPADWFLAVLTMPVLNWALRWWHVGTATDLAASASVLLALSIMIEQMSRPTDETENAADRHTPSPPGSRLPLVAALVALGVAFKLSTAIIGGVIWIIGLLWIFRAADSPPFHRKVRLAITYFAIPAVLLSPWIIWNIIASGYPLFPSTIGAFHVDWLYPSDAARAATALMMRWSRIPGSDLPSPQTEGLNWVPAWFVRYLSHEFSFTWPLLMSMAAISCLAVLRVKRTGRPSESGPWPTLLIASVIGLFAWFFTLPEPRYGESNIWGTTGLLVALALTRVDWDKHPSLKRNIAIAMIVMGFIWPIPKQMPRELYEVLRSPLSGMRPLIDTPRTLQYTRSGLGVYVPTGGEAWQSPLPSTPYFDPDLTLRDPNDMGKGFKLGPPGP